jgi:predicted RNA-binding protein
MLSFVTKKSILLKKNFKAVYAIRQKYKECRKFVQNQVRHHEQEA